MSESLTQAQQLRCIALEAARLAFSDRELTTSGFLSSASQFETFLATGLIRTGPKWLTGTEVGVERVSVMVEGPELDPADVEAVAKAVRSVL
jgi:hypothetical protein